MLISAILVFSILLIYLNVLFFKQEKEKIESQSKDLIAQSFFSIPYNAEGLDIYANTLLNSESSGPVAPDEIRTELQEILSECVAKFDIWKIF